MYTQLFSSAELNVSQSKTHSELSKTECQSVSVPTHSTQDFYFYTFVHKSISGGFLALSLLLAVYGTGIDPDGPGFPNQAT